MKQQRNTKQRQLVLEAVQSCKDHPTADTIYTDVREKDGKISRGTVYRNLNTLAEGKEITQVKIPAADRYDFRLDNHYHIICTSCGTVCDAPIGYNEDFDKIIESETGFCIDRHRTVFEGICPECAKKQYK